MRTLKIEEHDGMKGVVIITPVRRDPTKKQHYWGLQYSDGSHHRPFVKFCGAKNGGPLFTYNLPDQFRDLSSPKINQHKLTLVGALKIAQAYFDLDDIREVYEILNRPSNFFGE